jgi:predicted DNA-binding WGR domain protein
MVFFTRTDLAKNIRRFWLVRVTRTIFGEWTLIREWGRTGSPGTVQARTFESEEEACRAEQHGIKKRQRHGYCETQDVVSHWAQVMAAGGSIHAPKRRVPRKSKKSDYSENRKQGDFDFPDTSKNLS